MKRHRRLPIRGTTEFGERDFNEPKAADGLVKEQRLLRERIKTIWEQCGMTPAEIQVAIESLSPEALAFPGKVSDEQIRNAAASVRLFRGFHQAVANYIEATRKWEEL